jgi:Putative peptidoglycan binding domain
MKRLVILVTVLLVGLASVQAAQSDDQQKKKKKKAQTTQTATLAPKTGGTQTSKRQVSTRTNTQTSNQRVGSQTSKKHVSSQTSTNRQVTSPQYKKNAGAAQNTQVVRSNKANKSKKQTNVVTNNNVQWNKKANKQFKRSGNEWSYNVARQRYVRVRHDRNWWNQHYSRIVFYGGGYWYWNSGWWYPAWGYNPYYNSYVYDGPIFGYGYASPFDVTAQVQRALAARGYYYGPIDGIMGPSTRGAIQRYQIDRGLAVTAAIDEPTLATLGLA